MPKLQIQNEAVRANVALIIEEMRRHRQPIVERQKSLPFLLNRETGMLQSASPQQEYLPIELYLDLDRKEVTITEVDISKTARRIISETCLEIKKTISSLHDLRELSYFELSDISERSILHEAWFAVDRDGAEKLLLQAQRGSYLFRKDPFAGCLEELLVSAKKERLKCFTLTYVDPEGQVHDKTIVQWKDHWMFYDDDPTLSGDYYLTFDELLLSLGSDLKRPLYPAKVVS